MFNKIKYLAQKCRLNLIEKALDLQEKLQDERIKLMFKIKNLEDNKKK